MKSEERKSHPSNRQASVQMAEYCQIEILQRPKYDEKNLTYLQRLLEDNNYNRNFILHNHQETPYAIRQSIEHY